MDLGQLQRTDEMEAHLGCQRSMQARDQKASHKPFGRNLSIPASFKLQTTIRVADDNNNNKTTTIEKPESHQDTKSPKMMQLEQNERHRVSPSERSFSSLRNATKNRKVSDLPSSSPSSGSNASDSAFSQSQTTLGSESSESSCFRASNKKQKSLNRKAAGERVNKRQNVNRNSKQFRSNIKMAAHETAKAMQFPVYDDDHDDDDDNEDDDDDDDADSRDNSSTANVDDQFKLVWRNLTYRIPEKRFIKLMASIRRQRDRFWPASSAASSSSSINGSGSVASSESDFPIRDESQSCATKRVIFENLNGCAKSGELSAILGPSGAGKTTLLKCLTNRVSRGVSGSIDIEETGEKTSRRLKLCIIPQKDYLFDNLTVMENLLFASRIKNTAANFEHTKNVQQVSGLLGLQSCLKLKTSKLSGGQYKRVSIAQELLSKPDILILDEPTSGLDSLTCYRTVSVLRELVNMSRAGYIQPLAIIMTIHQPQIKIFNLFHQVYIMSAMGRCVYEGQPGYLIDTVADCCKLLPPPDDLNPASFIIDLASQVYGQKPIEQLTKLQRENFHLIHDTRTTTTTTATATATATTTTTTAKTSKTVAKADDRSPSSGNSLIVVKSSAGCEPATNAKLAGQIELFISDDDSTSSGSKTDGTLDSTERLNLKKSNNNNNNCDRLVISERLRRCNSHDTACFWLHTGLLIKRLWLSMWRDPLLTTTRVTFHLVIPFVFYLIYSQKSGEANACPLVERELDIQTLTSDANIHRLEVQHNELILTFENVSLFFILLYSFSMCVLAVTALSFPLNMQILFKETTNGWYSMPRFVMAKTLADLPIELTMPAISVSIAYLLTGQPSSYMNWRMLTITAVMTLCSLISQTQGLLFGAYFMNNVQAAVFISQASSLPWILLSGFTTRVSEMPVLLRWLSFGSIYRLGIESIVAVRYGFGMCPCDEELVDGNPPRLIGIPDQLKSVMSYYIDMYSATSGASSTGGEATGSQMESSGSGGGGGRARNSSEDIFERLASTLSRASTYGADIGSCQDVRPFILSAREVNESTLPSFLLILIVIFVVLKALLFFVVRLRAG